jgi:diguanylate cyclase (GGDEF)-like protein/PAS domain S-box-containing protein
MTTYPPPSSVPPSLEDVLTLQRDITAQLMRADALIHGDVDKALRLVTEAAAKLIDVRRASVWRFDAERTSIACLDLYDGVSRAHERGMVLRAEDSPSYFAAALEQRCIVAHDARLDPRTRDFTDGYLVPNGITAMLDAPVLVRGELVGVVCHEHVGSGRRWQMREELLACTLADFVGMAWSAAEHQAQARELGRLHDGLEILVEERTLELKESRENVRALFAASPVAMILTRTSDDTVMFANESASQLFGVPAEEAPGQQARDFWVDPDARSRLIDEVRRLGIVVGFESELRTRSGNFWGSISARSLVFESQPGLLVCVQDISERKELEQRLRLLATTDDLTGIFNRRHFFERAAPLMALAERHERPLSIAMLDVDHFKVLNDEHGHQMGDAALVLLTTVCKQSLRASDVLARFGGEEFVVLFPETHAEPARAVVERIQASLRVSEVPGAARPIRFTISGGVAEHRPAEGLDVLLRRADAALYQAKREGRDRVILAD